MSIVLECQYLEDWFLLRITQYTIKVHEFQEIKRKISLDQVKIEKIDQIFNFIPQQHRHLMNQDRVVINCTRSWVKTKSKLSNLMKISWIEGYNGKSELNPSLRIWSNRMMNRW